MKEIFGEYLYYPDSPELKRYPSPMDLKEKILISTKPPKEHIDATTTTTTSSTNMKHTERVKHLSKIIRKQCLQNDKSSSDEEVLNVPFPVKM